MKKVKKLDIPLTPQLKDEIIKAQIREIEELYEQKHKDLDDELKDVVKKIKTSLDFAYSMPIDPNKKPKIRKSWLDSEVNELKKLYGTDSILNIARRLNKNEVFVMNKLNEIKIQGIHKWTPEEEELVKNLYALTKTDNEISLEMRIPILDIQDKVRQLKDAGIILRRIKGPISHKEPQNIEEAVNDITDAIVDSEQVKDFLGQTNENEKVSDANAQKKIQQFLKNK